LRQSCDDTQDGARRAVTQNIVADEFQGCQMVYFLPKNHNFGLFWEARFGIFHVLSVYFVVIWCMLCAMTIWYILWSLGAFFPFWYFAPRKIWQP
jgi:hypothetical protein